MNIINRLGVLLLVALLIAAPALADASDVRVVQCDALFSPKSFEFAGDGTLLMPGSTGLAMNATATFLNVDTTGKVQWSIQNDEEGLYRSALQLDENLIVVLKSAPGDDNWVIEYIEDGQSVRSTKPIHGAFGLAPAPSGYFVYSMPTHTSARIRMLNRSGEPLWKLDIKEPILFKGIVSQGGVHIAYGNKTVRKNDREQGPITVAVAFDDKGSILWRHDSATNQMCYEAVSTDQGHIVLVGNNWPPDEQREPPRFLMTGFMAEYGENGLVWQQTYEYRDEASQNQVEGEMTSIIAHQDGYLVSLYSSPGEVRILYLNREGALLKEWPESVGNLHINLLTSLRESNGTIYLIATGKNGPYYNWDGGEDPPAPDSITIIKEIHMP